METENVPSLSLSLPYSGLTYPSSDFAAYINASPPSASTCCTPLPSGFVSDKSTNSSEPIHVNGSATMSPVTSPEPPVEEEEKPKKAPFRGKILANDDGVICFFLGEFPTSCDVFDRWPVSSSTVRYNSANSFEKPDIPDPFFPFHILAVVSESGDTVQFFQCQSPGTPVSDDVLDRYRVWPLPAADEFCSVSVCLCCCESFPSENELLQHGSLYHDLPVSNGTDTGHERHSTVIQFVGSQKMFTVTRLKPFSIRKRPADDSAEETGVEPLVVPESLVAEAKENGLSDSEDEMNLTTGKMQIDESDRTLGVPEEQDESDHSTHSCPDLPLAGDEEGCSGVIRVSSSVECPKCDVVLGSSKSLGGHMTMVHSRNSSKKLKCPKCNWHYKYQETLEIHMKDKHPESEETCPYCLTNQQHPRLARGEVYNCGYKPFRCDTCNYSTNSKGNLTIHMQSDKHVNNVQERQKNGGEINPPEVISPTEETAPIQRSASTSSARAMYRCDVCSYETNVSRNLRIHMTSEKHQQNYNLFLQAKMQEMALASGGLIDPGTMMSLMMSQNPDIMNPHVYMMLGSNHSSAENAPSRPGGEKIPEDSKTFQCLICASFMTNSLEELQEHVTRDRTAGIRAEDALQTDAVGGSGAQFVCKFCKYPTALKANFQLHCKTDKHVQKIQLVSHVREGGPENEWRLQYLNTSNPVQVRCNACDYQTSSLHQLRVHLENNQQHEFNAAALVKVRDLQLAAGRNSSPENLSDASSALIPQSSTSIRKWRFFCKLCSFTTKSQSGLMQHVRNLPHWNKWKQVQQGEANSRDFVDCLAVKFDETDEDAKPVRNGEALNGGRERSEEESDDDGEDIDEFEQEAENENELKGESSATFESEEPSRMRQTFVCPLCQETCTDRDHLEAHITTKHNVQAEALERLMMLVETSGIWNNRNTRVNGHRSRDDSPSSSDAETANGKPFNATGDDVYRCQKCSATFRDIDQLYSHQNSTGHLELKQTPRGPGYLCWKKGCNQYFKTAASLQTHFREIHARKGALVQNPDDGAEADENSVGESELEDEMNSQVFAEAGYRDPERKYKCHRCKVGFTKQIYLTAHNKTLQHRKGEKNNTSMEKYLDPNRPHKCEVCKESFTQKNILLVHYNSVSHLHKLKKRRQNGGDKFMLDYPDQCESPPPSSHCMPVQQPLVNGKKHASDDSDSSKPYRCDTCNVRYSSSSNLDIHLRSVLHQSKLSKLQNGVAVDLSRPTEESQKSLPVRKSPETLPIKAAHENETPRSSLLSPAEETAARSDSGSVSPGKSRRLRGQPGWVTMLEDIGSDIVQMFLENSQKTVKKQRDTTLEPVEVENQETNSDNECPFCHKLFSSPLVLKVHRETTHVDIIPVKLLDVVAREYQKSFGEKPKARKVTTDERSQSPAKTQEKKSAPAASPVQNTPNYPADLLAAQMQLLPLLYPGIGMGGMAGMMGMQAAMMNLQPPLIANGQFSMSGLEAAMSLQGFQDMSKNSAQNAMAKNAMDGQKRNRTRITDDQLQILRGNFNIHNPPSDEMLHRLCEQTGLELKVVKHWYRNTLFKERQRNKDSPYNFSVPPNPSTNMDVEEVDKPEEPPQNSVVKQEVPDVLITESQSETEEHKEKPVRHVHVIKREESVDSYDSRRSPHDPSLQASMTPSPTPTSSMNGMAREDRSGGKRANRTRFTDQQVKALQDYFDSNAYPKDDDLEKLSFSLGLSPRVITVWFQNARQKARKSYENQTPPEEEGPVVRTPSLNYQCKKCLQVFQRYYELIRHSKGQCSGTSAGMSANNNSRDIDDTCSVNSVGSVSSSTKAALQKTSQPTTSDAQKIWEANVNVSSVSSLLGASPFVFPAVAGLFPPNTPFGVLQMEAVNPPPPNRASQSGASSPFPGKRRASSDEEDEESPSNKRVRTTIQPEQLDHLYQQYKADSNPSRKQLELIATKTGLKKRVVQVWYQNTRARERKGQLHLHQLTISKRCPVCQRHFKVRSALESHISIKHADRLCKGEVNIDDLPDTDGESTEEGARSATSSPVPQKPRSSSQSAPVPNLSSMNESMQRYYEEAVKKYLQQKPEMAMVPGIPVAQTPVKATADSPLDLSSAHARPVARHGFQHGESDSRDRENSVASSPERSLGSSAHRNEGGKPGKRFRTQMSNAQLKVMKRLFSDYKTPTMGECELVGREIGLPKRVVQVWFQNARAKEKKQKPPGTQSENAAVPDRCTLCNVSYTPKLTVQDHLFTKGHIELLKLSEDCHDGPLISAGVANAFASPSSSSRDRDRENRNAVANCSVIKKVPEPEKSRTSEHTKKSGSVKAPEVSVSHGQAMAMPPFGGLGALMMNMNDPTMMAYAAMCAMTPYYPGAIPGMLTPYAGVGSFYDPGVHGVQLSMLNLPPGVLELIYAKLSDRSSGNPSSSSSGSVAFGQDGKRLSDLRDSIPPMDFACATSKQSDIGSVCRKCQLVFPSEDSCAAHQSGMCYPGGKNLRNILKLMQIHFHCVACSKSCPTVIEFRNHCASSAHQKHRAEAAPHSSKRESSAGDSSAKRARQS